jgi:DNA mismatch endonuclease, patch repair protein
MQDNGKRCGSSLTFFEVGTNIKMTRIQHDTNQEINDERKCHYCKANKTYQAVTKGGTPYPKWNTNPSIEDAVICGRCYRYLLYHKALPPSHVRRSIRKERISKRICYKCGSNKTLTQKSKRSSHHSEIWHKHPKLKVKWLCAKCYASLYYEPKRKFKTKEERYQYISNLFSGTGNPQYGNHTLNLGRVYTPERNRRVSEAVKKWAKTHPEHYYRMGVLGAIKARELGLSGTPTKPEEIMEAALKKENIRYVQQYNFGIGIMDFYLPEGNIALFVDGRVWHADPRVYDSTDILFFGSKISKVEWTKVTAADVWKKDRRHNRYLKSKGYVVIRFWEREIESNIDRCTKIIKNRIQL